MANFENFEKGPPLHFAQNLPILSTLWNSSDFLAISRCFIDFLVSIETRIHSSPSILIRLKTPLLHFGFTVYLQIYKIVKYLSHLALLCLTISFLFVE